MYIYVYVSRQNVYGNNFYTFLPARPFGSYIHIYTYVYMWLIYVAYMAYIYIWLIRTKYMYTIYSMYVYTYVYTSMKVIFLKQNLTDAHCSNLKFINFSKQSTNLAIKKYIQAGKNTNIFLIN